MSTQEIKVKASVDVDVQNAQAQLASLESQSAELKKKIAAATTEFNQRMSRSMSILENNLTHMMGEQIATTPYAYGKDSERQRQIRNKYINEKMTAGEVLKTAPKPLGLMEKMNMARLEKQSAKGTISSSGSSALKTLQKRQEDSGLMSLYIGDKETKSLAKANEAYLREVQEANAQLEQLAARRREIMKNFPSLAPQASSSYVPTSKPTTGTKMERPDSVYQRRQAEIRKEQAQEMKAAREANVGKKYQIGKTTSIGTHSFKGSDGKDVAYPAVYSSALTGLKYTTSTGKQKEVTGETAVSKRILDELYKRNQTAANGESAQTIIDRIFSDLSRAIDQIDTGNVDTQTLSQLESVIRNFAGYKEGGPEFTRKSQGLRENFNKIRNSMIQWQTQMQSEAGDMQSDDSEAIEFRKWQQSQGQKYVTDETDQQAFARKQQEYIDEFVSQYQKEAGTTGKRKHTGLTWSDVAKSIRLDPANKDIKQSVPYNVNQDGEIEGVQEENISAMLKNIMRFSVAGDVVGGNAEAQYFLGDSQKDALSVMQKLTAHLRSNPKVAQALDGKSGYGSNEQLLSLLEEMQKMYVSFLEGYNDDQMDGGIKSQIKTRLSEISQVLGNADMNGGLSKEAVDTVIKDLSPQSNRAVRSITAKMGNATGKYPRGLVGMGGLPVQYTGGMPFMPDKENIGDNLESNFKTVEGRTELLKQFAFRAEDLKAKIAGTSDTTQQQALTTELDAVIKALNEVFNTLYSSSDPLVKNGLSASQQAGLEQIKTTGFGFANGQIKSFDQMGESDFDSANSTQLKSMIEYFQNQIKQIAPKNTGLNTVSDYKLEADALTALLMDYQQEIFTQSDMDEILSDEDTHSFSTPSVDLQDIGLEQLPWKKNANGEYQVTRQELQERVKALDAIVDSGVDPEKATEDPRYKELLSVVDGLKLKLESKLKEEEGQAIDSELQSFASKYATASSAERGQITKQVKTQFAGNKEALAQWEQKKKAAIAEMKSKASQDASIVNGEIKEVVAQQQQSVEAVQITTGTIAPVDTPPPTTPVSASASLGGAIGTEAKKLGEENQQLNQHVVKMGEATQAEQAKILVSENLAKVLAGETSGIEKSNQALAQHVSTVEAASSSFDELKNKAGVLVSPDGNYVAEGYLPAYDAESHSYRNPQGQVIQSSTHVRDVLMGKFNPSFKQDMGVIQKAVASLGAGQQLTPEMVGMAGNQKAFDFMTKRAYASTEMGNVFHEVADAMAQTGASSLGELQTKPEWAGLSQLVNQHLENLAKVGVEYTFENLEKNVKAYQAAIKASGLSPTAFSETPLAFKMTGKSGQAFEFGVTPDQLFSGELGTFLMDSKTGKVGGYESFQLSMQGLAMKSVQSAYLADKDGFINGLSNKQLGLSDGASQADVNAAKQNIRNTLDVLANTDLSKLGAKIVNVKDGAVELIDNGLLTMEELFRLFQRFDKIKTGQAEPLNSEEQKVLLNRQRDTGRYYGTHDGSTPDFGGAGGSKSKKLADSYVSNYKQQQRIQEKIQQTNLGMQGKSGESLVAQQSYLRALEQQLSLLKQQAPVLDLTNMKINEEKLTKEQVAAIEQKIALADKEHLSRQAKITASQKQQVGFFGKLFGGLKNQLTWMIDSSLSYQVIGKIRQAISTLINTTKQLDAVLVDIQIATGNTREETRELLITYTDLAKEMGRTTQSVAQASNDWLRAGYEGQQAAELTRASMMLSTLGMIEATDATTYLISTLKGWKISANEVINVVDKLTAVDMAAAISAGDLALAMSRANNSARMAGSDMNKFIGYVTTVADVTQKSAESVGESFKTIYSRFGNIKANKYVATTADMDSADYNSDEFENLNDIETVLTKQGIRLRETAGTWREIDAVIEEVAEKWKTWDQTTKNAVATVVAGTRQRENVITLFENWENVSKYAEIAENAYGTATQKMEAYTTSVEASKQRLTVAVEEWALKLNGSDAIRAFYDGLTFLVENIHTVALTLMGIAALTNIEKVASIFSSGLMKLSTKIMGLGNMFTGLKNQYGKVTLASFGGSVKDGMQQNYLLTQQQAYGRQLDSYTKLLGQQQVQSAKLMQTELLRMDAESKKAMATILSTTMTEAETQTLIKNMSAKDRAILAETLLTQEILQTTSFSKEKARQILESIDASNALELTEEQLRAVTEQLIAQRKKMGATASGAIGTNLANSAKTNAKTQLVGGIASIGGMLLGSAGGSGAVELVGEKVLGVDVGDTGKTLGTLIGGTAGTYAASALASGLVSGASLGSLAGPIGIIAGLLGGLIYSGIKKNREKEIKEAQEDFKELEQRYSNAKSLTTVAAKFDELSKGVDSFGRNVSLSEEDYQSFLDCSNQLVEAFPDLLSYTDAQGNSIAIMGSEAESTSEYIQGLIKNMQDLADQKMIVPEVMGEALKNAQKEYEEAYNKVYEHEILSFGDTVEEKVEEVTQFLQGTPTTPDGYLSKEDVQGKVQLPTSNAGPLDDGDLSDNLNNYFEAFANSDGKISVDDYYYYQDYINKYQALLGAEALRDNEDFTLDTLRESGYSEDAIALIQEAYDGWQTEIGDWNNNIWGSLSLQSDEAFQKLYTHDSNTEEFSPEFSSNVAQDFLTQVNTLQSRINEINNSMSEYALAYARTQGVFDNLSEEQSVVMKQALSGINVAEVDEFGNVTKLSQEDYEQAVRDVANGVNKLFEEGSDNNIIDIALKLDEAATTWDFELARGQLRKALVDTFGEDGFSDDEMKIMIAYGFEHDGSDDFDVSSFKDTKSRTQQIADALGVSRYQLPASDWGIYDMNEEEFKNFYELASSGAIRVGTYESTYYGDYVDTKRVGGTSAETVQNLMRSKEAGNDIFAASEYSSSLLSGYAGFETKLQEYYTAIQTSYDNVDDYSKDAAYSVAENFSHLPEFMREAIVQGGEEILKGNADITDAIEDQMANYEQAIVNSQVNIATIMAKDQFSGIELDGYIDSWSELQQALEQVSASYEKLKNAQKEQDATGRLSWETTLDLLTTNMDYVNALEVGADGIRLKTDAEAIMMGVQIATIQANIDAAIAEKQLEIQSLRTAIQEAKSGQVTVTSTNANIDAHNAEIQSLNALAQAYAQVANLRIAATTGTMGDFSATDVEASLQKVTYTGAELDALVETWKEQAGEFNEATGEWTEGSLHQDIMVLENLKGDLQTLVDSGYSAEVWESNFDTPDLDGGDVKDEFEKLKDLMGALNKEFHQMLAYADEGLRTLEGTAQKMNETYYEVKGKLIDKAIARGEVLLGGRSLEDIYKMGDEDFDKYLGYYTELQELYVERNNLDDEEIEDKIKIAELEGASLTTMKDIQTILIGTSDTYEERLQRQKDFNGLLDDEYRLTAANRDLLDKTLYGREAFKEGKSLLDTSYYSDLKGQIQAEIDAINAILENDKNPETQAKLSAEEVAKYKAELIGLENELALVESTRLEELQDQQENEGTSIDRRKDLQQELIASASTYEKKLEYQKGYNDLLDEEYQLVKANREVISQEAYMRAQYGANKGGILDSTYYTDMFAQIDAEKQAIQNILDNNALESNKAKLTEKELLDYQGALVDLENERATVMDEYLGKLKEEAENQKSNLDIRKDLQKELINSADTYEELLQRQQEYNDLLKEEQDLRESIASSLNDEYLAMQAFQSGGQTSFYDLKDQALKDVQDAIDARIMNNKFATGEIVPVAALESGNAPAGLDIGSYVSTSDGRIYEIVGIGENSFGSIEKGYELGYNYNPTNSYWSKETDYIANGTPLSDSDYVSLIADQQSNYVDQQNLDDERIQHQINLLKGQKADLSAVTAQYKQLIETADTEEEFYDYYQQYLDAFIAEFDDKISDIQRKIDDLEKAKPHEWKSTIDESGKVIESATSKIKNYYSKMDQYYKDQKAAAEEALKHSADLTEEEIEHLVDQANDAIKSIHENAIAQAEDLKAYQESVYSALTNEVQRYIDDLEKQKEIVEETYDKELEKLQDKEDAIARTNKLIELQNNLLNAQKEKERVYREGIGWTYESNREKVKTAENELNDFYRQDNIDDLNNAKDAELKNLDDRIKNWEDYLAMLNEKYNEYAILEEKRLLRELLNVETDAEIKAAIVADMANFTTQMGLNYDTFIADQSAFYLSYNSTFSAFLSEYSTNLATLASLKAMELSLLNSSSYASVDLSSLGASVGSNSGGLGGIGTEIVIGGHDWATDTTDYHALALGSTSSAEIQEWLSRREQKAEAQGIDISGNGSYKSNDEIYQDWINATGGEYTKSGFRKNGIEGEGFYGQNEKGEWGYFNDYAKTDPIEGTFADGILGGPVTYTGLTMLHGTPSEPEYVLNNDQAYNLLRYIATKKMPAFDSTNVDKSGIQYIVEGDIVLEGVDNPQEFWGEVTKAMGNRWNVTKNR